MTNYYPLAFACFIQLTNLDTKNALAIVGQVLNGISLVFLLLFPVWCMYMVNLKSKLYDKRLFTYKYGALTDDYEGSFFINCNFSTVLCLRKVCFMVSIVWLYDYPSFNLLFLMMQSLGLIVIIFLKKPFARKSFNLKNMVQECVFISLDMTLLLIFYGTIPQDFTDNAGWVMIALCCALIVYNLYFVLKDEAVSWRDAYNFLKRLCTLYKKKKTAPSKNQRTLKVRRVKIAWVQGQD